MRFARGDLLQVPRRVSGREKKSTGADEANTGADAKNDRFSSELIAKRNLRSRALGGLSRSRPAKGNAARWRKKEKGAARDKLLSFRYYVRATA